MTPVQYKKIWDLIISYGSSQFIKGGYNNQTLAHLYEEQAERSEYLLKEIKNELNKLSLI